MLKEATKTTTKTESETVAPPKAKSTTPGKALLLLGLGALVVGALATPAATPEIRLEKTRMDSGGVVVNIYNPDGTFWYLFLDYDGFVEDWTPCHARVQLEDVAQHLNAKKTVARQFANMKPEYMELYLKQLESEGYLEPSPTIVVGKEANIVRIRNDDGTSFTLYLNRDGKIDGYASWEACQELLEQYSEGDANVYRFWISDYLTHLHEGGFITK